MGSREQEKTDGDGPVRGNVIKGYKLLAYIAFIPFVEWSNTF